MNQLKAKVARAMAGHADVATIARMLKEVHFPESVRILGESVKVKKGVKKGVLTAVVYLAPYKLAVPYGGVNNCPNATPGCARNCLGHCSGRLAMSTSRNSQIWKSLFLHYLPAEFWAQVEREIRSHARKAKRTGLVPAVRFNGSSDRSEVFYLAELFPGVRFYDYTKDPVLATNYALGKLPPNYHITFSMGETPRNQGQAETLAKVCKVNVAVVFRNKLPDTYWGLPVIDGDETDVRFYDPRGVVVGLTAKGKAKTDQTGFVQD